MWKNITNSRIYALNDDAKVQTKVDFEEVLRKVVEGMPNGNEIIIADLNARVRRKRNNKIVGPHGEEVINDNGEMLINFCKEFDLRIMNTLFDHRDIHKYTW